MMKAQALLFLAIVSSYIWKPGGSSQILTRGDGDSFPFPSVNPLDLGAAFLELLRGTSGSETPTTDQNSDQNSGQSSGPGPATEPIFQLNAETSQPSAVYRTCDPGSDMFPLFATSDNCRPSARQIIFTEDCAGLQNVEIETLLNEEKVEWYPSRSDSCGGGAIFYLAMLNADQVLKFKAMINVGGVLAVVPDKEIVDTTDESDSNDGKSVDVQSEIPYAPVNALLKGPLKKRDEVILQGDADQAKIAHLIFLSYPYQMSHVEKNFVWPGYRYFSSAGEGVMVYVIDNGAEPANAELATTGVIQRWLYAADIKKTPTEYVKKLSWKGHGSCSVSLVAAPKFGLAKKAKVIMVKNSFFESGVLDAFQKIINDLDERNLAGETTAGWTVISMQGGIEKSTSDINRQKLGDMILKLMNDYKVVVVIAAGGSWEEESQGIFEFNRWPQLFSLDERYSSMITVGAVTPETGTKFSDSKISPVPGRGVNVWAPGSAWCASGYTRAIADVGESSGTSVAAPIVAGLVAYLLSLKGVGDQLRQSHDFAGAVLTYIQDLSQPRDPAYPSVWNGLNSLLPGPDYGWQA